MCKPFLGQQIFFMTLTFCTLGNLSSCNTSHVAPLASQDIQAPIHFSPSELFQKVDFIEHLNPQQQMQNYLALNISFREVERLRQQVELRIGQSLKNRGEAHITVITPIEFKQSKDMQLLGMKALHEKAIQEDLQNIKYVPICIGRSQIRDEALSQNMLTYFIVVKSPQLLNLRKKIKEDFKLSDMRLENFYPHITLGFTHRDLHFEEGAIKNENACWISLSAQE